MIQCTHRFWLDMLTCDGTHCSDRESGLIEMQILRITLWKTCWNVYVFIKKFPWVVHWYGWKHTQYTETHKHAATHTHRHTITHKHRHTTHHSDTQTYMQTLPTPPTTFVPSSHFYFSVQGNLAHKKATWQSSVRFQGSGRIPCSKLLGRCVAALAHSPSPTSHSCGPSQIHRTFMPLFSWMPVSRYYSASALVQTQSSRVSQPPGGAANSSHEVEYSLEHLTNEWPGLPWSESSLVTSGDACSSTEKGELPWWIVDLQSVYLITSVLITNNNHRE